VTVTFVAASTAETPTTAGSLALGAFPTGVAAGDIMLLVADARNGSPIPQWALASDPAGWTRVGTIEAGITSTDIAAVAWWAIYNGANTLPTVTVVNTASISLACFAFRGVDTASPIRSWTTGLAGATTTVTIPALTGATVGDLLVGLAFGRNSGTAGYTGAVDGGYTERVDISAGDSTPQSVVLWAGTQEVAAASVASQVVTFSGSLGTRASAVVALAPAVTLAGVADALDSTLTWHVDIAPNIVASGTYLRLADESSTGTWYQATQSVLGSFELAGASQWTDVSSVVRSMEWSVSTRSSQLGQYGPGSASITLDNRNRDFDPLYLSGAYADGAVTGIRPGIPVRIWCTYPTSATVYYLFRGWVDAWEHSYAPAGENAGDAVVVLRASDSLAKAARITREAVTAVGADEKSIDRFYRVLDSADWPSDLTGTASSLASAVDPTDAPLLAATTLDGDPISEIQTLADAVGGAVYADGTGRIMWAGRAWYQERADSVLFTFDAAPTAAIPTADFEPVYDRDELANTVTATREGGTAQTARDAASVADYGVHGDSLSGLPLSSDTDAYGIAAFRAWLLGQPRYRVRSVQPLPRKCTTAGITSLLGMRHLDLVSVTFKPPGSGTITQSCWVEGWSHSVDASTGDWSCRVVLSDASQFLDVLRLNDDAGVVYDPSASTNYVLA
jgi:hypothetical protein